MNGTLGQTPLAGSEVILRAGKEGAPAAGGYDGD